jgi:hypothetical protein
MIRLSPSGSISPDGLGIAFEMSKEVRNPSAGPGGERTQECPKCSSFNVSRSERKRFMEKRFYAFFGYFPWKCLSCRERFLLKDRGEWRLLEYRSRKSGKGKVQQTGSSPVGNQ